MNKRQFNIAQMRNRAGFSQQQAADALGIKKARYGDWERETREINLRDAIKLADLFHCTLDELAGRYWPSNSMSLSSRERRLIGLYRDSDERGQVSIDAVAIAQQGMGVSSIDGRDSDNTQQSG